MPVIVILLSRRISFQAASTQQVHAMNNIAEVIIHSRAFKVATPFFVYHSFLLIMYAILFLTIAVVSTTKGDITSTVS